MAMLADSDEEVRNVAVNKVLMIRGEIQEDSVLKDDFVGGDLSSDENEGDDLTSGDSEVKYRKRNKLVRKFTLPVINEKAKVYHKLININHDTTEPPLLRNMSNVDIENIRKDQLKHPYHNQGVECTIKVVSVASARVVGKGETMSLDRLLKKLKIDKIIQ